MAVGGGSSMPDYSNYRGVYIEDVDGYLYTEDEWDGSKTANGIAVLTDNCRFVIALEVAHPSSQWGNPEYRIDGITTTYSYGEAIVDYDGKWQTETIIVSKNAGTNIDTRTAAYYCYSFTFPNGNYGYLGAAGEWKAALDNKEAIDSAMEKLGMYLGYGYYWTSTQINNEYSWIAGRNLSHIMESPKTDKIAAWPFTTLKSDEWSEGGGGDEGGEGDSSTANIYWETQQGVWNKDIDSFGNETYTCESPGDSGSTVIRCYFSGVTSITFRCVSYGENNYDYLTVGSIDDYCTRTHYMESLKGENGAYNTITYDCDKGEHFVEFCYSKDSSDSEEPDNASVWVYSYLI